jgi:hypothetical protein
VADIWACFNGEDYGDFSDIDKVTMFADYRVPQILNSLGCLWYSPSLESTIRRHAIIESGHSWEVQLRGQDPNHELKYPANFCRLQHMVCGIDTQGDFKSPSRCEGQCYSDRFLFV